MRPKAQMTCPQPWPVDRGKMGLVIPQPNQGTLERPVPADDNEVPWSKDTAGMGEAGGLGGGLWGGEIIPTPLGAASTVGLVGHVEVHGPGKLTRDRCYECYR